MIDTAAVYLLYMRINLHALWLWFSQYKKKTPNLVSAIWANTVRRAFNENKNHNNLTAAFVV